MTWRDRLGDDEADQVRALLLAAHEADGRPEVDASGDLPKEFRGGRHLVASDDQALVGYAHLDTDGDGFGRQVAEVVVHPRRRRHGIGATLVEQVLATATRNGRDVRLWAHGDHPAAARIAERHGLRPARVLLTMALDGTEVEPPPHWPKGVSVRTFVPGRDEDAVVTVNHRAFDWHPEQGALTADDLRATEREPWFDPDGFFLAEDSDHMLLGFHWTKVHADGTGEVYVVGVDPAAQGSGLGKALTVVGLRRLHQRGVSRVILYVESDNKPAVAVYERLGFTISGRDVQYSP